jgi:cytochrome c-type biogenesis protein CcmE
MSKAWILSAAILIFAGIFLVVQATSTQTSVVISPSELVINNKGQTLERLRVAGKVSDKLPINYQHEPYAELSFGIENPGLGSAEVLAVSYRGVRPDMFAVGRDIIMDGDYLEDRFQAATLLTQCPSKYEPPKPQE